MRVFYYYSYLFYSKILRDSEPHLLTVLALSFLESLIVNAIIETISVHAFCEGIDRMLMFTVLLLIIGMNYFLLYKTGKAERIVKLKPQFFNSHAISIVLTLIFVIGTLSLMFWGPIYIRNVFDKCR